MTATSEIVQVERLSVSGLEDRPSCQLTDAEPVGQHRFDFVQIVCVSLFGREPNGIVFYTFTPLYGLCEIVHQFLEAESGS